MRENGLERIRELVRTAGEAVIAAFSMFSAVPMPRIPWEKRHLRYVLWAFPLVGLALGVVLGLWVKVSAVLGLPPLLRGAGLCWIPVWFTGGIHLDGYADTWDARTGGTSPESRRAILKDPHLGAFAAMHLCGYFLLRFALWTSLPVYPARAVTVMLCLSRSLSALALASFPLSGKTGLAHVFAEAADRTRTRWAMLLLSGLLCGILCMDGVTGLAALAAFYRYQRIAQREFGGLSGDLAGWFLETAELWMLVSLCLGQYVRAKM